MIVKINDNKSVNDGIHVTTEAGSIVIDTCTDLYTIGVAIKVLSQIFNKNCAELPKEQTELLLNLINEVVPDEKH